MIKSNKIENNNKYNIINERPLPKKVVEPAELNEF